MSFAFLTIGFGFKTASVPFHMWTPDARQGDTASITAFMATGVKDGGFSALVRVFFFALPGFRPDWTSSMWLIAVATMTVGNIVAISQTISKGSGLSTSPTLDIFLRLCRRKRSGDFRDPFRSHGPMRL